MPKHISKQKIIDATLKGINKSQKDYEKWTGGDWLLTAPEYLISTNIAYCISLIDGPKYITLENNVKTALDDAGALGKGRLKDSIRSNGKVDILVWWGKGSPRAVIEVKNQIHYFTQVEADINRIIAMLNRKDGEHSIQFGILAFYTSTSDLEKKTAKERIEDRLNTIMNSVKDQVGEQCNVNLFKSGPNFVDDSAWVSASILFD